MANTTSIWEAKEWNHNEHNKQSEPSLQAAADVLREGGLVAFPTETVYGLGADARNSEAVAGIFAAKGRPSDNPLIVHIANVQQLNELLLPYPDLAKRLMDRFWPGPLTIVLPVRSGVLSPLVTANLSTVGVRMPDHPLALELIKLAGCPVAAPSANRSGRPSPTLASHVIEDLDGRIAGIIDGGATGVGLESTVLELEDGAVRILRPGGVTEEDIRQAFPEVELIGAVDAEEEAEKPRSPGMKYTHYAPKGELAIVDGAPDAVAAYIAGQTEAAQRNGQTCGVLAFSENLSHYKADLVLDFGSSVKLEEAAHRLYAMLRAFDEAGIERIWAESAPSGGIGGALMNRLKKAAGGRFVKV
ncbi:L-threonylcarbamoyladenylate synthase [Paenibacillus sp. GCM10027627]|uniref:L-threonylcarbamoyladenylate synthase n=1 Tax=unclassified Paenibacillus TaxID=185978 RepID=UPI00362DEA91